MRKAICLTLARAEQSDDRNHDQQLNQCKTFLLHFFLLFLSEIRTPDRLQLRFGLHVNG